MSSRDDLIHAVGHLLCALCAAVADRLFPRGKPGAGCLSAHQRRRRRSPGSVDTRPIKFRVEPGTPARQIGRDLEEAGLIRDALLFEAFVRANGLDNQIQAGTFVLAPAMTLREIVTTLERGPPCDGDCDHPRRLALGTDRRLPGPGRCPCQRRRGGCLPAAGAGRRPDEPGCYTLSLPPGAVRRQQPGRVPLPRHLRPARTGCCGGGPLDPPTRQFCRAGAAALRRGVPGWRDNLATP